MAQVSDRVVGIGALAVAALLLVVFWTTREWATTPPVYDGLPLQTEPYRYLQPTPGQATTAPPTSASQNIEPSDNLPFVVNTNESPPQAALQAMPAALDIPPSVRSLTITITPVPPPAPVPRGKLDGNVYRVSVTVPVGVGVSPGQHVTVILRGTGAPGAAKVDRFSDGQWTQLMTIVPAPGLHAANTGVLGDFALVLPPGSGGLSGGIRAAIAVAVVLVVIGLLLVGVRLLRRT